MTAKMWMTFLAAFVLLASVSAAPQGMISHTTEFDAVGGSCSACCISKDTVCMLRNGDCLSAAECDAKSDYRATRLACSNGVCCVPRRSSPPNGGNGTRPGSRTAGTGGRRPDAPYGRRMIVNTTQCEAVGGSCSASADCDSSNVFVGSCDNTNFGCCISKDAVCVARNGECLSAVQCDAKSGYHATRMVCSDGVCCVPKRSSSRNGGDGTRPGSSHGGKDGGRPGHRGNRPAAPYGRRMISNTTQCVAVSGSCSASADCDLSSNVFVGSCDNTGFGCCVSKDNACMARNGECLSAAECNTKSDYRATRMACSNGICCVPRRSSPRNGGNGSGPGSRSRGKYGRRMGPGRRGSRPRQGTRGGRPRQGTRGRRPGHGPRGRRPGQNNRRGGHAGA